ncbi:hypothetical protein QBC43DRAFT_331622 [Cladorrhinum sp. PSN259]|nr:hypothetical protein QBC43DRAFT_331622 [Cladorrhinum sp. PSN259]
MDPFSLIGLVASILTFVDFAHKVLAECKRLNGLASDATIGNGDIESLTTNLQALSLDLKPGKPESAMNANEFRLNSLAKDCQAISADLLLLLDGLKPKNPKSTTQIVRAAWRAVRKKNEVDNLAERLKKCQQLLHLQLSQVTRLEVHDRLDAIQHSQTCEEEEIRSLSRHIEVLGERIKTLDIHEGLLRDVQSLLAQSQEALCRGLQAAILAGLVFEKMYDRVENIEKAYESTFDWLLKESALSEESLRRSDNSEQELLRIARENDRLRHDARDLFVSWLSKDSGIFHISGKPGCGKSTLMKYISTNPRTQELLKVWAGPTKKLVHVKFFFWRHGSEYQRSFKGLLRSLLYSILDQCPNLIETTFPTQWQRARLGLPLQFEQSDIKEAFDNLVGKKEVYANHRFAIFIDGLDEFQGREDALVQALLTWVKLSQDSTKICVSSRELPIFQERFSAFPKLRLHELTQSDILHFVREVLDRNEDVRAMRDVPSFTDDITELGNLIAVKAEGVFLWVALVLKEVEDGLVSGDRVEDLAKKIDFLPSELERLFDFIIKSITDAHPVNHRRAFTILHLALLRHRAKDRAPRLLELSFLDEFENDKDFSRSITKPDSPESIECRLKRYQKQIDASCRGLVTVVSSERTAGSAFGHYFKDQVAFTHRALVEFLLRRKTWHIISEAVGRFNAFQFRCQTTIAELQTCATGLPRLGGNWTRGVQARFNSELLQLLRDYYDLGETDSSPSYLLTALQRLRTFTMTEAGLEAKAEEAISIPYEWTNGLVTYYCNKMLTLHVTGNLIKRGAQAGLQEFLLSSADNSPLDINDQFHCLLVDHIRDEASRRDSPGPICVPPGRRLRFFRYCLDHGLSPETPACLDFGDLEGLAVPTIWHLLLWYSVIAVSLDHSPALLFSIFLANGANPHFWLSFDPSHGIERFHGMVAVMGHYGLEKHVAFSPIFVPARPSPVLDLARQKNWLVSLKDLVELWTPRDADKVRKLIDMNANDCGRSVDQLQNVKIEFGLDADTWPVLDVNEEIPQPLFPSWDGTTKRLDKKLLGSNGQLLVVRYSRRRYVHDYMGTGLANHEQIWHSGTAGKLPRQTERTPQRLMSRLRSYTHTSIVASLFLVISKFVTVFMDVRPDAAADDSRFPGGRCGKAVGMPEEWPRLAPKLYLGQSGRDAEFCWRYGHWSPDRDSKLIQLNDQNEY